jgi:hypothetical protein
VLEDLSELKTHQFRTLVTTRVPQSKSQLGAKEEDQPESDLLHGAFYVNGGKQVS